MTIASQETEARPLRSEDSAGPSAAQPSYRPFAVEVVGIDDLSPSFRRLTFSGPDLQECGDALLDQRVKLLLGEPRPELTDPLLWYLAWRALPDATRPVMRTYTLSGVDQGAGRVSVDFACRPAHGPASHFAADARLGQRLVLVGPNARSADASRDGIAWRPGAARDVLLVGDETAVPAIRNIIDSLGDRARGQVVLDLPHVEDAVDIRPRPGLRLDVVARDPQGVGVAAREILEEWFAAGTAGTRAIDGPALSSESSEGSAEDLVWDEGEDSANGSGSHAWLAGEAGWMAQLRRLSRANAVAGRSCGFMGYWRTGRTEDS